MVKRTSVFSVEEKDRWFKRESNASKRSKKAKDTLIRKIDSNTNKAIDFMEKIHSEHEILLQLQSGIRNKKVAVRDQAQTVMDEASEQLINAINNYKNKMKTLATGTVIDIEHRNERDRKSAFRRFR